MSKLIFHSDIKSSQGEIKVNLLIVSFTDENNIRFVYSPHLDLTGYGNTLSEAKESFEIAFADFIQYTINKKTLGKVLTALGWNVKGSLKRPKKVVAPSIKTIIGENDYVSEIFDKYRVNTYHQEVGIPA